MRNLENILYFLIRSKKDQLTTLLSNDEVLSILVIRNNKRIGNIYFLLPFIHQLRANYPNAHITLMLNAQWQGHVFENINIDKICYSNFSFTHIKDIFQLISHLRLQVFDLLIVPNSSTGDSIFSSILRAKNKVSSYRYARTNAYTHTFLEPPNNSRHSCYNSLYLLEKLGGTIHKPISHYLEFKAHELQQGIDVIGQFRQTNSYIIAFFRGARGKKLLTAQVWQQILANFDANADKKIIWLEILSPDITAPLNENYATYQNKNMRILASVLKAADVFICCDTGPLHLADAAGAACIGLYTDTSIDVFGIVGSKTINISDIENINVLDCLQKIGVSS